jgi:hypothetical protein
MCYKELQSRHAVEQLSPPLWPVIRHLTQTRTGPLPGLPSPHHFW